MLPHLRIHAADAPPQTLPVTAPETAATLADFLANHGLPLNTRCGGRGLCNGCQVQFAHAATPAQKACRISVADALALTTGAAAPHSTFSILHSSLGGEAAAVTIPARSLLRQRPSIADDFRLNIPAAHDPLDAHARYGVAVDVGTTTVALLLCDLETGKPLSRASAFNAQIRHGEDVLTRIELCRANPAATRELQRAIAAETIQPLLADACARAHIAPAAIGVMTAAGNTTMQHLLTGENPRTLGVHPFTPVFLEHRAIAPEKLGLAFGKTTATQHPLVHLLPGLSSYVGADLAAGLIATGMIYDDGPALLVDIGTNGEIIAKIGDKLIGCATAAGPAFEGAGLTCGTRATDAAIQRVRIKASPALDPPRRPCGVRDFSPAFPAANSLAASQEKGGINSTPKSGTEVPHSTKTAPLGNPLSIELGLIGADATAHPIGVCGSGYIDFLWEARRAGLLLENGRFSPHAPLHERSFCLTPRGASGPLYISEPDIVRLLQAKAAIAAGITTLLEVLGIRASDVKRLYLAGGFGMHISLDHAIGCGLLPNFTPAQIQVVGNTSLDGAYLALNDRALLDEMRAAAARFEPIELNLRPNFEDAYIDNLALP